HMRRLPLVVVAVVAASVLTSLQPTFAQVQAVGYGGARPEAPTGPVPRLSNGMVDFNGAWMGVGPNSDIEKNGGLKPGELESLMMPAAKALFANRKGLAGGSHVFC